MKRLNVLVSAYACEPGKGSEAGVGWNWVKAASRFHNLWVITRANNREAIEAALKVEPIPEVRWFYYDCPAWALRWKNHGRRVRSYYYLWQLGSYGCARRLCSSIPMDVVHHLTLSAYWLPSFLPRLPIPFMWGPIGGAEPIAPPLYGTLSFAQRLREQTVGLRRFWPWLDPAARRCLRRSSLILAQTPATLRFLPPAALPRTEVYPAIGIEQIEQSSRGSGDSFRVASVGNLYYFKGVELGLRAFAKVAAELRGQASYWVLGDGPERSRLMALAAKLGVAGQVYFSGQLPRAEVLKRLQQCDVMLHSSWRDPPVFAVLEAMAAGLPVVCLDSGGPAVQVAPGTGIRIKAAEPEEIAEGMAAALLRLARDADYRAQLGREAAAHARQNYLWARKAEAIARFYTQAASASGPSKTACTGVQPGPAVRSPGLRVAGNAALTAGAAALAVLLAVLATPFMLAKLKADGYGVYVLLATLVGYYGLLDLGVGQALARTVARHLEGEARQPLADAINTALVLQAIAGVIAGAALAGFAPQFSSLLQIPLPMQAESVAAIRVTGVAFLLSTVCNIFRSILAGLERYGFLALIDSLGGLATTVVAVLVLLAGGRLLAISIASAVVAAALLLACAGLACFLLPWWRFRVLIQPRALRELVGFGWYISLGRITQTVSATSVRVLLAAMFGPAAVAQYVIPQRIIQGLGGLLSSGASVLFPHASRRAKECTREELENLYRRTSAVFSALAFPGLMALAALAGEILSVWIGPRFAAQNWRLMQWLCFSALLGSLSTVPIHFACALGHVRKVALMSVATGGASLLAAALGGSLSGLAGAVVGVLCASGLWPVCGLVITWRYFHLSPAEFAARIWAPDAIGSALLFLGLRHVTGWCRLNSWPQLLALAAAGLLLYALAVFPLRRRTLLDAT